MSNISELLLASSELQPGQLNSAQLKFPDLSLIESILQLHGDSQSRLISLVARSLGIPQISGQENLLMQDGLLEQGQYELQRLIYLFKALPLGWINVNGRSCIQLVMANPTDTYAQQVFANYFGAEIAPAVGRESEILAALRYKIAVCPEVENHFDRFLPTRLTPCTSIQDPQTLQLLTNFLSQVLNSGATKVEFDFCKTHTTATVRISDQKYHGVDLHVSPESFVEAVLSQTRGLISGKNGWQGIFEFELGSQRLVSVATFHEEFRNSRGTDGKALLISDISVFSSRSADIASQTPILETFRKTLAKTPGVYIGVFASQLAYQRAFNALHHCYPDCSFAQNLNVLSENQSLLLRSRFSRVFVPLSGKNIASALEQLALFSEDIRTRIAGIFCSAILSRCCPHCRAECQPTSGASSLLTSIGVQTPKSVSYPRGCKVCSNSGYAGTELATVFVDTNNQLGSALRQGQVGSELVKIFQASGTLDLPQILAQSILSGSTTAERIAIDFLGRSDVPADQALASGKKLMINGEPIQSDGSPLVDSPLYPRPMVGKNFHSVVLKAGEDLLGAREALLAEEPSSASIKAKQELNLSTSGNRFHSVVLKVGDDVIEARRKLLAESRKPELLATTNSSSNSNNISENVKPKPTGNKYHSQVISLDDDTKAMRKKLTDK